MERIQQALDKAGKQRQQGVPENTAQDQPDAPVADLQSGGISYSQTRVIQVSQEQLKENRIVAGIKTNPHADTFRVLRSRVLQKLRKQNLNTLAITSPNRGSGKSMVAVNLAISLSLEVNQTVMLVDLDLRRPSIHKYFNYTPERGISDYLEHDIPLSDLLVHPSIERLVLLPGGSPVTNSSELLTSPRMTNLVEEISNRYASRIILFDLPPLLHMDDALAFLPQVQSSLLVVEEGATQPEQIEQSIHLLEDSNLLGTIYNKARHVADSPY
ncbi:MAG: AAA family ATPase [Gammaproteobacteria bacterium]|nr:AAA family ATPase [Gammaproteobacteria bacterium]